MKIFDLEKLKTKTKEKDNILKALYNYFRKAIVIFLLIMLYSKVPPYIFYTFLVILIFILKG